VADFEFTDNAKRDLFNIVEHTKKTWGTEQANTYINNIEKVCQLLADNPHIGILRDETGKNLMSHPIASHFLYYQHQNDTLTVVRILHKNMLPENNL